MTQLVPVEQLDAARAYEALHVPALFRDWAPRVAAAARVRAGQRVLDVACGTGVLAREVASRTGPAGHVAGVDTASGMLALAGERAPGIDWRLAPAERLPFDDREFDVVVSQFGLMFFDDPPRAIREMVRVLAPGGRLAVAVWDGIERAPVYCAAVDLLERRAGSAAADALRAPFTFGDRATLRQTFLSAGVHRVEATSHPGTAHFPGVRVMMEADLRGWLPLVGVELDEPTIAGVLEEAERVFAPHVRADGSIVFDLRAIIVTGRRPAA